MLRPVQLGRRAGESLASALECVEHCRKLGHHLTFHYCRTTDGAALCPKILDCWFELFDIRAYLEQHYSKAEIDVLLEPPKPKVATLLELIEKAKRR